MDKDGDGLLSLDEAVSSITEIEGVVHADDPEIVAEKERHVQKLIENFKLSASCLQSWMVPPTKVGRPRVFAALSCA